MKSCNEQLSDIINLSKNMGIISWLMDFLLPAETRELARLNRIWESFNDKTRTKEEVRQLLNQHQWKHHRDKVELLRTFLEITRIPDSK